mmetsp:Transcript_138124/g.441337  ORF Transcript_138124/g.441337 Transcript_138124/m.441337 type:complete len:97 (+) Transcript_138124:79-369(+)
MEWGTPRRSSGASPRHTGHPDAHAEEAAYTSATCTDDGSPSQATAGEGPVGRQTWQRYQLQSRQSMTVCPPSTGLRQPSQTPDSAAFGCSWWPPGQ